MNDFKKALIDVAGDLSDSERHVKQRLQRGKRVAKRNWLVAPVFIMALGLLLFSLWLMPEKAEQQATIFNEEALFDYYKAFELMVGFYELSEENEGQLTKAAFENYKTAIAIQMYAKVKGLTYSKAQFEEKKKILDDINHHKDNTIYSQMFTLSELTEKQYEQQVVPILIENQLYMEALQEKWMADNPKLLSHFADYYTKHVANRYLEQHFSKDLQLMMERYDIAPSHERISSAKSGTIAAIDGMMIYFVQNATYDEIQQMTEQELAALEEERLKAWLINVDDVEVQVGDFVRVFSNATQTSYDAQITNGMANQLEVVMPAQEAALPEIELPESALGDWYSYFEKADWQAPLNVTNYLTPQWIVHVEGKTYTIFKNDYHNVFIVPYKEQTIGKLTKGQSEKMTSLLQQFVPK